MKNKILVLLAVLMAFGTCAQAQHFVPLDTIFDLGSFRVAYSYGHQAPAFVVYRLYKPQAKVKRDNLTFQSYEDLPHFNYYRSGYDRGHMVAAADRAGSLAEMKETFYFVNVLPQTPELNRGRWKVYEDMIRKMATTDSLLVVCGGGDYEDTASLVPHSCFKIVYSMTDRCAIMAFRADNSSCVQVSECLDCFEAFPYAWVYSVWRGTWQRF